jgi:hypothetical protein
MSTTLDLIVSYPPPATGTNYNLVEKVEHNPGDKVIWLIINSPEGRFTYDYKVKPARRGKRESGDPVKTGRLCSECRKAAVVVPKRFCEKCAKAHRVTTKRVAQRKWRQGRRRADDVEQSRVVSIS